MLNKVLIIAEAGVNHNGRIELALQLCDAAKEAGVDIIKFQTWKTEKLLTNKVAMAKYQRQNTGVEQTQFEMLKKLELGYDQFRIIKKHCDQIGIKFLSTPDEEDSLNFLVDELYIDIITIGSGEITNIPYLRKIGSKRKPVILSTGMSYLGEVEKAIYELVNAGTPNISLLHCTTNYPCAFCDVNLSVMQTLKQAFGLPVGYSDHTVGIEIPIAAAALGAEIIEKHFSLDKTMIGPDHAASIDPQELRSMVSSIRNVEIGLGCGRKVPNSKEIEISKIVRKVIVAERNISNGQVITEKDINIKRAGAMGISAQHWDLMIGSTASRAYFKDELINAFFYRNEI